ncbi:MAG: hypothetical protein R3D03_13350 [Geminicoccaceae bacterium]
MRYTMLTNDEGGIRDDLDRDPDRKRLIVAVNAAAAMLIPAFLIRCDGTDLMSRNSPTGPAFALCDRRLRLFSTAVPGGCRPGLHAE